MDLGKVIEFYKRVVTRTCLAVGPCFLLVAVGFAVHTALFLRHSIAVKGKVVRLAEVHNKQSDAAAGSGDSITYAPVFEFVAADGCLHSVTAGGSSNPPAYEVGESVPVLYEVDRPVGARIDSFWELWGVSVAFGLIGFIAVLTGLVLLGFERRRRRKLILI